MKFLPFIVRVLKAPLSTGAIAPSSRALGEALISAYPRVDQIQNVVEVGAGTGAITRVISEFIPEPAKVTLLEIDYDFSEELKRQFPKYSVVTTDAALLDQYVKEPVDLMVCSLPWTLIPRSKRRELLSAFKKALHPESGVIATFVYVHMLPLGIFRELMEDFGEHFQITKEKIVYGNLPPAQVISLRN